MPDTMIMGTIERTEEPLVALWFEYEAANAAQKTEGAAFCEVENAAYAEHPPIPEAVRWYPNDGRAAPVREEELVAEINAAPVGSEQRKAAEQRLVTLREWRAACTAVNARHGLPQADAKSAKAGRRYTKAFARIENAEPRTVLGVLIKVLASDEADDQLDDLADESGVDVRRALGDLVRRLATDSAPLSAYRRNAEETTA